MNLRLALLVAYCLLMIAIGLGVGRRVKSAADFFVAGRHLGSGLLFSTLVAANIGAGSTVGATGLGYRDGLAAWWWVGSAGMGSLVLAFTVGPRIWRIARERDLRTVGDFLEHRYGRAVRVVIAVLLWLGTLAILAGQLIAMSRILHADACVPPLIGMAARALHPGLPSDELALPTVLTLDLPPLLGSLGLAAVVSAEASSADAILFMLSTSLSQDLYRGLLRPKATDAEILRVARVTAVVAGAL